MRKFAVFFILCAGVLSGADAAAPVQRRGRSGAITAEQSSDTKAVSARAATVTSRTSPRAASTVSSTPVRGRTATTQVVPKNVSARAATTQKVINTGTKVATAAKNVLVSEECQAKYEGCMDAFCMLDNETGGRCICSNKNAEFDSILAEIEKLDQQSYQMATFGVDRLEMGTDADATMKMVQDVTDSLAEKESQESSRRTLDLSLWNTPIDFDVESAIFQSDSDAIEGKEGDVLHVYASGLCTAQIPECAAEMEMLKMMYGQKIRSDCAAYENSLKQQRNASAQKLAVAEQTLRQTALEQYRNANKYDLGQCTVQFKQCMQTTGGCGNDFAGCATMAAMDATNTRKSVSGGVKAYRIKGASTTIEINASTYDTLLAKKPLCETVTKSCVAVADQVWDTFLREVAPQVKSAEIIAEDKARQNCVGNVSSCFQKACKDTIDPNDPDGSYDLCLTRPETMLNLCQVPLNACGIDASSPDKAMESDIWEFVVARLASIRVDSCTSAVKECLQSTDRCGKDYSQCIGLDTDTIMRMCPHEKLVACQQVSSAGTVRSADEIYDELANMVQGIMLNIDNNMLTQCQNALNAAVVKVCGDTGDCSELTVDNGAGTRSFKYEVCQYTAIDGNDITWNGVCRDSLDGISEAELTSTDGPGWAGKLSGMMYWGDIKYSCTDVADGKTKKCGFTTMDEYIDAMENAGYTIDNETRSIISERVFGMEVRALTNAVETAIDAIESDPMVQFCMTGRRVQGMKTSDGKPLDLESTQARFPNLTVQMRQMIAASALKTARDNYNKKYDAELKRMMQDQVKAAARIDKNNATQVAAKACEDWAEQSTLPESEAPKASNAGKWVAVGLLVTVAIVATVYTGGALAGAAWAIIEGAAGASAIAAASVAAAAVGGTIALTSDMTVGQAEIEQWNYKENVTTTFAPTTGVCTKVRVYQNCKKTKNNYCKTWADPVEVRDEVTLL